jgi:hypothetical protein
MNLGIAPDREGSTARRPPRRWRVRQPAPFSVRHQPRGDGRGHGRPRARLGTDGPRNEKPLRALQCGRCRPLFVLGDRGRCDQRRAHPDAADRRCVRRGAPARKHQARAAGGRVRRRRLAGRRVETVCFGTEHRRLPSLQSRESPDRQSAAAHHSRRGLSLHQRHRPLDLPTPAESKAP